ncbi:MAG: hypothetical protein J0H42_20410 [Rhizobiales bacterium]|nr:hypothetical protein [Hyphomicrobiales bacterium]
MSMGNKLKNQSSHGHRGREGGMDVAADSGCSEWPGALLLWRTVPAHGFDFMRRAAVTECMRRTSSTIDVWRKAVGGDAASAMGLALRMEIPSAVTARTDLVMTVLLHSALRGSAGAALVLSYLLRRMPIDDVLRRRLATSWLAHNVRLALPELERVSARRRAGLGDGRTIRDSREDPK